MHDARGGTRDQTSRARCPTFIKGLKARATDLVTLDKLLKVRTATPESQDLPEQRPEAERALASPIERWARSGSADRRRRRRDT